MLYETKYYVLRACTRINQCSRDDNVALDIHNKIRCDRIINENTRVSVALIKKRWWKIDLIKWFKHVMKRSIDSM